MSRSIDSYLVREIKELERLYERVRINKDGTTSPYNQIILDAEDQIQTVIYDYKERIAKLLEMFEGESHDDDEEYDE